MQEEVGCGGEEREKRRRMGEEREEGEEGKGKTKRSRHPHSFQKVTQLQTVITSNNSLRKEGGLSG